MGFSLVELDPLTGLPIGPLVEPPPPAKYPQPVSLNGSSVCLEPLSPELHADALWKESGGLEHAALWQYMHDGPFQDRHAFDQNLRQVANQTDPFFFAIVNLQTQQAVGRCAYLNIKPEHRCIEVGNILFGPSLQRTRGATEVLYLMARHVFEDLGYRRYEWKCNALNSKSCKAAERFGYVFEGIFRHHLIIKGRSRDTAWFSILAAEWPTAKKSLESWLSRENFDAEGRQIRRLGDV